MRYLFLVLFAVLASAVSAQARPLTDDEKVVIADAVKRRLKDPESAQFKWPEYHEETNKNYCGLVNAKNSYGGYTGFQVFHSIPIFKDGKMVGALVVGDLNTEIDGRMCVADGYDPSEFMQ